MNTCRVCKHSDRPFTHHSFTCDWCSIAKKRAKKYRISVDGQYKLMYLQKDRCAICEEPITMVTCHLDHDHSTGRVRGFLCPACNLGLVVFEKKGLSWAFKARAYLVKSLGKLEKF